MAGAEGELQQIVNKLLWTNVHKDDNRVNTVRWSTSRFSSLGFMEGSRERLLSKLGPPSMDGISRPRQRAQAATNKHLSPKPTGLNSVTHLAILFRLEGFGRVKAHIKDSFLCGAPPTVSVWYYTVGKKGTDSSWFGQYISVSRSVPLVLQTVSRTMRAGTDFGVLLSVAFGAV